MIQGLQHKILICLVTGCFLWTEPFSSLLAYSHSKEKRWQVSERFDSLEELRSKLANLFEKQATIPSSTWGVKFYNLEAQETIYELNSRQVATPASNQKILTAAAFLDFIDTSFYYTTRVWATKQVLPNQDGLYVGDLVVTSNGNPTLSDQWISRDSILFFFEYVAKELKKLGARAIEGDIVGDDSYFQASSQSQSLFGKGVEFIPSWEWEDLNVHSSSISSISFNENIIELSIESSLEDDKVTIEMFPENTFIQIENQASLSSSQSLPKVHYRPLDNKIHILGNIYEKLKYSKKIKVPYSTMFFLTTLKYVLAKYEIELKGRCRYLEVDETYDKIHNLSEHKSPSVYYILERLLKESSNFLAESSFYSLGAMTYGAPGTYQKAKESITTFLSKIGIDSDGVRVADGSGLSRLNAISPRDLVYVLMYYYFSDMFPVFLNMFPLGGVDGTLESRFQDSLLSGCIWAKTGSLTEVRTLSGYIKGDRSWIAFSITANKYVLSSSKIEEIIDAAVYYVCLWANREPLHSIDLTGD